MQAESFGAFRHFKENCYNVTIRQCGLTLCPPNDTNDFPPAMAFMPERIEGYRIQLIEGDINIFLC